jgi:DNA adenine methylase
MPDFYEAYYEPMVGGGSVFLAVGARHAILGDSNEELLNFYGVLRDRSEELIARLEKFSASKSEYYRLRESNPRDEMERAVRFAYLNRLCWNGLYRVNRDDRFNVPFGNRTPDSLWDFGRMRNIANRLEDSILFSGDFAQCLANVKRGDFVFLDPPYPRGSSNGLGFNRYTSTGFSFTDHKRLANVAAELDAKGVKVMICETGNTKITNLFPSNFELHTYSSKSLIAASAEARREIEDAILTNYRIC